MDTTERMNVVPSSRKQINVRMSEDSLALMAALRAAMKDALGMEVSQADVLSAGMAELRKRYLPANWTPPPPPPNRD